MSNFSENRIDLNSKNHKVELLVSQQESHEDEISLGQLVQKIIDGKRMIILSILAALLITIVGFGIYSYINYDEIGLVSTVISFNFKGIDEGLNPDEEDFNVNELTNKRVLQDTIDQLGLDSKGIDSEDLRKNIEIKGIIPEDTIRQITLINQMAEKDVSQLEKLNDMDYHPRQYKVDLHIKKSMDLTGEEAEQILMSVVNNYKIYFMDKYNDRKIFSAAITDTDFDQYDYSEYILLIDSQLEEIINYLEEKNLESPEFRSKSTGAGFEDLISQVEFVRNVDVSNVQSIIDTFVISKDKDRLSKIYSNKIQNLIIEMEQYQQEASALRSAANEYKKDSVIILGNENAEASMEITKESEAYDKLIENAVEAENLAAGYRHDILRYEELLNKLTSTDQVDVNLDMASYIEDVENDIKYIAEKVKGLVESINKTLDDYYTREVFKDSVKIDIPAMYSSNTMGQIKKFAMVSIIATILGLMIGLMGALSKGMLDNGKQGDLDEN